MPRKFHSTSPEVIFRSLFQHRHLIWQLTRREVIGRYRGSILGLLWSFLHPIVMLSVYTFVFSVVFKQRWPGSHESRMHFALIVFAGLTVFTFFSEMINRSPQLITINANYVKKVVFPLEILPYVATGTALFHAGVSLGMLLAAQLVFQRTLPWTVVFLPFVLLAFLPWCLGLSWLLASLGTFVRDTGQVVAVIVQVLLFMTPIFYPISALPESYQTLIRLNPLNFVVEEIRAIAIYGNTPDWVGLAVFIGAGMTVAWMGLAWFQRTRNGFANVV